MSSNTTATTTTNAKFRQNEKAELQELWKELGLSSNDEILPAQQALWNDGISHRDNKLHPILAVGIGTAALINIGILLSIPPVLRGKGG